jgi:hypothetical protein
MTGWTSADHRRRPLGLTVHRLFLDSSLKYRAIGYIRVSTEEQADSGAGLAAQRAAIIAEADHCGWSHLDVIEDAGASGSDLKRPGITAALTAWRPAGLTICGDIVMVRFRPRPTAGDRRSANDPVAHEGACPALAADQE